MIELREGSDGQIYFSVADDGIGLPSEKDLVQSSSLGLQLVPLFVEQLHGTLEIERQGGTRFCIRFPKSADTKEEPE